MALLKKNSTVWSRTFFTLGIAHRLTQSPAKDGRPVAVTGQTLRCFDDQTIRDMLGGAMLIDSLAAEVLVERGFGPLIGVESGEWKDLEETAHAYEQINEDDPAVYGIARPRMTAVRSAEQLFAMTPVADCEVRTQIHRADHSLVCPGLLWFHNSLGGTIATWTYPMDGRGQFFMGFFNVFRRKLLQNLLAAMTPPHAPLALARHEATHLYRAPTRQGLLLAWLNPTHDTLPDIRIALGGIDSIATVQQLDTNGEWREVNFEFKPDHNQPATLTADATPPTRSTVPAAARTSFIGSLSQ